MTASPGGVGAVVGHLTLDHNRVAGHDVAGRVDHHRHAGEPNEHYTPVIVAVVNGAPIRTRDVGLATDGTRKQRSSTRLDGVYAVSMEIGRQSGAHSYAVFEGVRSGLDAWRGFLPPGVTRG